MEDDDQGQLKQCPSCGDEIWIHARVCKFCRTDFSRWGNTTRFLPVLGLAVAIMAMAPNFLQAVGRLIHPPTAKVQIVGLRTVKSALEITAINLGDASAVSSGDLTCLGNTASRAFNLRFSQDRNVVLKPDETVLMTYGSVIVLEIAGEVEQHMLDEEQEVSGLRRQIVSALRDAGADVALVPNQIEMICQMPVAGQSAGSSDPAFDFSVSGDLVSLGYSFDLTP